MQFVLIQDRKAKYNGEMRTISIAKYRQVSANSSTDNDCQYYLDVYPSPKCNIDEEGDTNHHNHFIVVIIVLVLFIFMSIAFYMYDQHVHRRIVKVNTTAARSDALVSSLFPSNVRARLLAGRDEKNDDDTILGSKDSYHHSSSINNNKKSSRFKIDHAKQTLKGFLAGETNHDTEMKDTDVYKSKPIADLFPETTGKKINFFLKRFIAEIDFDVGFPDFI